MNQSMVYIFLLFALTIIQLHLIELLMLTYQKK